MKAISKSLGGSLIGEETMIAEARAELNHMSGDKVQGLNSDKIGGDS